MFYIIGEQIILVILLNDEVLSKTEDLGFINNLTAK